MIWAFPAVAAGAFSREKRDQTIPISSGQSLTQMRTKSQFAGRYKLLNLFINKYIPLKYIFIILLSFLCACSGSYLPQQYEKKVAKRDSTIFIQGNTMKDSFEVQYLGCGGLILSRGKDKMVFDPFFSNPSFGKIAKNGKLQSDTNVINQVFKTLNYQGISTCLISHAHNDHLMDVP